MKEGTERFLTTFEMCDNPIRWHKYYGQTNVILESLILQMDILLTTMNLISTYYVISKRSANLYKMHNLLTYDQK